MFSNEVRSIRAALGGFTGPLTTEDRQLVRQARENLEALAVQIDAWEGGKPEPKPKTVQINITPQNVGAALGGVSGRVLSESGGF